MALVGATGCWVGAVASPAPSFAAPVSVPAGFCMPEMGTVGTSLSGAARFPKARTITRTSRPTMMAPTMMSGKYEPMFAAMPGAWRPWTRLVYWGCGAALPGRAEEPPKPERPERGEPA